MQCLLDACFSIHPLGCVVVHLLKQLLLCTGVDQVSINGDNQQKKLHKRIE